MIIVIKDLSLRIPDRPGSQEYLALTINQLSVGQSLVLKPKRVIHKPEQRLYVKAFKINCDDVLIKFGQNSLLTKDTLNIKVTYENLAYSPLINRIDPYILDKSSTVTINLNPVEITLPQNIYTGILRCMDLNINFTDFKTEEFFFVKYMDIEDYYKQLSNVVSMIIKLKFKALSIKLSHLDGSFLSELILFNLGVSITKFMD